MRRLMLVLGMVSLSAFGVGPDKRREAAQQLEKFKLGQATVNETVNRIQYLGQEAFATQQLAGQLNGAVSAEKALLVLSQVAVPDADAEKLVQRTLKDPDISVAMLSMRTLGRMKATGARAAIEAQLKDSRVGLRKEAAEVLGRLGVAAAGPALLAAAKVETEPDARVAMLVAVGRVNDAKQAKPLEKFLEDGSEATRLAAVQALCLMGTPKGAAEAKKLLESRDPYVRLQGVKLFEGAPATAAKQLVGTLQDPTAKVRATAGRIMAQAGIQGMTEWLVLSANTASADDKMAFEIELEPLRLTDVQRAAIIRRAAEK